MFCLLFKVMQSQTGATMSMACGAIYNMARKQKVKNKSSPEVEVIGADDMMPQKRWTRFNKLSKSDAASST
jgi:hypothetical protein